MVRSSCFVGGQERLDKLTDDVPFLARHALSLAPSPQGIEGQKSSLLPIPKNNELNRLFFYQRRI